MAVLGRVNDEHQRAFPYAVSPLDVRLPVALARSQADGLTAAVTGRARGWSPLPTGAPWPSSSCPLTAVIAGALAATARERLLAWSEAEPGVDPV